MVQSLPTRREAPPDDVVVVVRAGVMDRRSIEVAATRCFDGYGVLGISVEGVIDGSVSDACRTSRRLVRYRHVRLSTFGRLRAAGFALVATFDHPHFTLTLPDLSEVTLARLSRAFDPRSQTRVVARLAWGSVMATDVDIAVDFMDMRDDGRLWTRMEDVRPGFEPTVGQYAVVGDEDADPAVARIVALFVDGGIELEVLDGGVDEHRHLLTTA